MRNSRWIQTSMNQISCANLRQCCIHEYPISSFEDHAWSHRVLLYEYICYRFGSFFVPFVSIRTLHSVVFPNQVRKYRSSRTSDYSSSTSEEQSISLSDLSRPAPETQIILLELTESFFHIATRPTIGRTENCRAWESYSYRRRITWTSSDSVNTHFLASRTCFF